MGAIISTRKVAEAFAEPVEKKKSVTVNGINKDEKKKETKKSPAKANVKFGSGVEVGGVSPRKPLLVSSGGNNNIVSEPAVRVATPGPGSHDAETQRAVLRIQSVFRGFKERKEQQKRRESALSIQRHVRGSQCRKSIRQKNNAMRTIQEEDEEAPAKQAVLTPEMVAERVPSATGRTSASERVASAGRVVYSEGKASPAAAAPKQNVTVIGDKTKEEFHSLQSGITDVKWQADQQIEATQQLSGKYCPQKFLLIASNLPKADSLASCALDDPNLHVILYDFTTTTFEGVFQMITDKLFAYYNLGRIKSIAFMSGGEPGFLYLLRGKVCTDKKLEKDEDQREFFVNLAPLMSKVSPEQTFLHLISNNIIPSAREQKAATSKGKKLGKTLQELMLPMRVHVASPVSMSAEAITILAEYVDVPMFRTWKRTQNSKLDFM